MLIRRFAVVGATVVGMTAWLAPPAFAVDEVGQADLPTQTDSVDTTSSTSTTTTTTTDPTESSTTVTTTTIAEALPELPDVTVPPELIGDSRAPVLLNPGGNDGGEVPLHQIQFDHVGNGILQQKVAEFQAELGERQATLLGLEGRLIRQRGVVSRLTAELETLDGDVKRSIVDAVRAEEELRSHTVEAFINGDTDGRLSLVRFDDPVQLGVAREMLGSVVQTDEDVVRKYNEAREKLAAGQEAKASSLAEARSDLSETEDLYDIGHAAIADAADAIKAYESGSQIYVRGFVFPIAGDAEFIDSWGFPRMMGTSSQHWHQGSDVFAKYGTPLVAAESGVLFKVGQASLGGTKLWIRGDSGTEYYYAHLSAIADGVVNGKRVNVGDVVGYVGDSGNARGTPPHLHFEVHTGGSPINPYPLLKATYGTKPMVEIVLAPEPAFVSEPAVEIPAEVPAPVAIPPATSGP